MKLIVSASRLAGSIAVPGSKSHTIRGIVAALLADGTSVLHAPLESADTRSALAAAVLLGARAETLANGDWRITGTGGRLTDPGKTIDMGNSGTGTRLLAAAAAHAPFRTDFDGDASLRTRPMRALLAALAPLGVESADSSGKAPFSLRGPLRGGRTKVDGTSSQYLSALLFSCPLAPRDTVIDLDFLNEQPYVRITLDWLAKLGLKVKCSDDLLHFEIPGGQRIAPFERVIPADFSTAAFPLGAAAIAGDRVEILNLDFSDAQGDKAVFEFFRQQGAHLEIGDRVAVDSSRPLAGGEFDLNATPDALPLMAAVAATQEGRETRLVNVPQARIKETDRIACMTRELRKMGAEIEELPDGMIIRGGRLHGAELESYDDHRIAMALAVAALRAESPCAIDHAECAAVTYPGFVGDFRRLGADFRTAE